MWPILGGLIFNELSFHSVLCNCSKGFWNWETNVLSVDWFEQGGRGLLGWVWMTQNYFILFYNIWYSHLYSIRHFSNIVFYISQTFFYELDFVMFLFLGNWKRHNGLYCYHRSDYKYFMIIDLLMYDLLMVFVTFSSMWYYARNVTLD